MCEVPSMKLNDGTSIPILGLGTWQGPPGKAAEVGQAVKDAIDIGYRHLDCAHVYKNEAIIGDAIAEKIADGSVKREELYITTKLWNTYHRPEAVEPILRTQLENLKLDYVDLYLIHWPHSFREGKPLVPIDPVTKKSIAGDFDFVDTWAAMEQVRKKGLTKSIGISNFNSLQIERLLAKATIVPAVLQIECHPYLNQKKLREFCKQRGIAITAYSPLGSAERPWQKPGDPDVLSTPEIKTLADKYGKTPAQILLRYNIQLGNVVIPKSSNKARLAQNINVFDFELTLEDMDLTNTFNCNGRLCLAEESTENPFYPFHPHVEF